MSRGENVLPLHQARAPQDHDHDDLVTAQEAIRRFPGIYPQQLYAWVAAGMIRAYRSRYTKYTLYSMAEIRQHHKRDQAARYAERLEATSFARDTLSAAAA